MNIINQYKILLFAIPFVLFLIYAWFMDYFPKENIFKKFMDLITEKDLEELLKKNGFQKTTIKTYQLLRFAVGIVFVLIFLGKDGLSLKGAVKALIIIAATYKLFYIYLLNKDRQRIKKLNQQLPYLMKALIYLMYSYGVTTAIKRAIESVNTVFKYDLTLLLEDIDKNPNEKQPYQNFVDRYDGKINNLDVYLTYLYRIQTSSSTKEATELMASLNDTIAHEVSEARRQKNEQINFTIGYIGFLPVIYSAFIIVIAMILSLQAF